MPTLYQLDGAAVVRVFPLTNGVFTIGRGTANDVVLVDAEVSRVHCRLTSSSRGTMVEDLRSRNGTWLANKCLSSPTPLKNGDRLRIGQAVFVFRDDVCDHTLVARPLAKPSCPSRRPEPRPRREEFRFKIRWQFDWSGFAFGWRIRRE